MNIDLVIEIAKLAVGLVEDNLNGTSLGNAANANTLLNIVQKAAQVYAQQTGAPLDPALIKAEIPV